MLNYREDSVVYEDKCGLFNIHSFLSFLPRSDGSLFANEESVKRELENDFICDELARANQPYANSGEVSGIGMRQAFNICTTKQF